MNTEKIQQAIILQQDEEIKQLRKDLQKEVLRNKILIQVIIENNIARENHLANHLDNVKDFPEKEHPKAGDVIYDDIKNRHAPGRYEGNPKFGQTIKK